MYLPVCNTCRILDKDYGSDLGSNNQQWIDMAKYDLEDVCHISRLSICGRAWQRNFLLASKSLVAGNMAGKSPSMKVLL